ncbi:MAG TPA: GldG family protein [Hyphomicrobiaceae bacterium]|nr:GldG family protein [Hyphomicrobiaceae bacterium]
MNSTFETARSSLARALDGAWTWALERSEGLSRPALAWGSLALAGVILLSVNLMSSVSLRNWKADLTEDRLFTISDGTRQVLRAIDEPIKARVYFSSRLAEAAPSYARYFDRVRALLEQYRDISGGKLELAFLDPEPFSDAEDRAVAAGLRGIRLNAEGELGYFGLVATNATDNQETIGFFSPDRESFLEYDATKLVHTLANPKKHVVGLITALPVDGGKSPMAAMGAPDQQQSPPWLIMDQIREFFEVETLDLAVKEIPSRIDVLLVAQPVGLTPDAAYAIDQYALKGGKVLVFADPFPEASYFQLLQQGSTGQPELIKLLKAWGVDFDTGKVAADIAHARRVQFGGAERGTVTEYVAWLGLDKGSVDQRDVLSGGIELLNLATAGFLTKIDGAGPEMTPILVTSKDAMEIPAQKVGMGGDPLELLRGYKPGGKPLVLAARVSGEAKSAFPDGAPKAEPKKDEKPAQSKDDPKEGPKDGDGKPSEAAVPADGEKKAEAASPPHVASGKINAIVVADTDMLADRFWVEQRELLGQQVLIPHAHNAAFVLGGLENLSGSDALIALRGRGVKERPFTWVEDLRRDAERQFREKEQALTQKLKGVEAELQKLEQSGGEGGNVILSDAERQSIERFRTEMLDTRRQLRDVKLALRHDIDNLDGWLKFTNIAFVPLAIAFAGVGWSLWHGRQRPRPG